MADLDGDGLEDALVANESGDRVSYCPNLGEGQWGSEVIVTSHADGCQSVYAADLDLDGDLDILSASVNDDKVAWYENLGAGQFGMQQPFTAGPTSPQTPFGRSQEYRSVLAVDVDGDNDLDVIAGAQSMGIDLFLNVLGAEVGCSDSAACNYAEEAELEYGCQFDCYGCTQPNAQNFDAESTLDDGSCLIPVEGCASVSGIYSLCLGNLVDTVVTFCADDPSNGLQLVLLSGALEE